MAEAIETALADISITGPLSGSLGVLFEAPLFEVPGLSDGVGEDPDGVTLGSDTRVTSSVGSDPGQCIPPAVAPNLLAFWHVDEAFRLRSSEPVRPSVSAWDLSVRGVIGRRLA